MKNGVLIIGSTNMDMVVSTDKFPKPGETILGKKFQTFPGGKGANQAVGVAKLGVKTYFITKLGNDEFKNKLLENLNSNGVETNNIILDEVERSGIAVIFVNSQGQNEIVVISGSNMNLTPEDIDSKKELFTKAKILLTQLEIPIETIIHSIHLAKENNLIVILNPAPAHDLPDEIFPLVDVLTPNENELETLTGIKIEGEKSIVSAANCLLNKGVKNIVVTLGEKGAILINSEKHRLFTVNKVQAIDTTAAGDAFNAGLAYALLNEFNLDDAINFANSVAAIAVTRLGAQTSMPTKSEVLNSH